MDEKIKFSRPVPPFVRYCAATIPTMFDDSLSYYEALCALNRFIQKNVVEVINVNAKILSDLKDYTENYFENLDVQEEINNKLDAMAEDGTLQEIISSYIQSNVAWTFDSVSDMQSATNLIAGSYAQTYGFHNLNDGGGALYLIREGEENETANGITTFSVDSLIAELVNDGVYVNMKKLGMSSSNADNASILQYAVNTYPKASVLFIPSDGDYAFSTAINLGNKAITIKGTSAPDYDKASNTALVFANSDGFTNARNVTFKDLCIKGNTTTPANKGITGGARVENCVICYFNNAIACNYQGPSIITNSDFHHNASNAITNPVDSRITNCTINDNGGSGINLQQGANDNIIANNKIEWNVGYGVSVYNAQHSVITNNIFDRNGKSGIYLGGTQTRTSVISGNVLRRNGATSSSYDASNFQINAAYDSNIISENVTLTGNTQDDGSGTTVPNYALHIRDTNANQVYLTDNVWSGGTNANPIGKSSASNVVIIDQNHPVYESLASSKSSVNIASGASGTITIPFETLPEANNVGVYKKVITTTRNSNDAGYSFKEFYIYLYKQYGNYAVSLTEDTIRADLAMTAAYDSDSQGVTITIANSHATATFTIQMTSYSN